MPGPPLPKLSSQSLCALGDLVNLPSINPPPPPLKRGLGFSCTETFLGGAAGVGKFSLCLAHLGPGWRAALPLSEPLIAPNPSSWYRQDLSLHVEASRLYSLCLPVGQALRDLEKVTGPWRMRKGQGGGAPESGGGAGGV